jgi:tetratricopeptide (TPR) repeat protein
MVKRQEVFQQAMNQGHSAAWDQMWDRAAVFYRQALEEYPDHPQALNSLGLALIELQEFDEALICYQKAARATPDDPIPLEKVAQLSERMGNLDQASQASLRAAELYLKNREVNKAVENWERVTRLNPDNLLAHSRLALVYERTGEKHKSVTEYLATASLLQSAGESDKALQAVNQAMKILPNNDEVLQAYSLIKDFKQLPKPSRPRGGTAPLRMSQVRKLQAPQTIVQPELDPVSMARQKALTILAGMLFDSAEEEAGDNGSRRGLQDIVTGGTAGTPKQVDRNRMVLHLSQVVDLQTHGEFNQAVEELRRAMDAGLDNMAAVYDMGYLYLQTGRPDQAVRYLQQSVKHQDYALGSRLILGELYRKRGRLKEASLEYLEALKLADSQIVPPEYSNDLRQLYDLLIDAQHHQNNREILERICDNIHEMLMRSDWRVQLRRAREQLPGQDGKGPPIPLAEILIEAHSGEVIAAMSAIHEMVSRGQMHSAMEEAFYALQEAPTYLPLHAIMGEVLYQQGELAGALEKFSVISRTYANRGDVQQAINYARRIVELAPTDLNARRRLIEQLLAFGRVEPAIEEYIQLAEVYYSLADLNMARKTYTEALRTAQQAGVDRSLRVRILHRMADIDVQSLDWRQALRVLEQIRTLQPEDFKARLQIIELNLRLGQEPQALAEVDNCSAYLSGSNQPERLIQFMKELIAEYPQNIPMRRRLADVYRDLDRKKEAINELDVIGDMLLEAGDRGAAIQTVEMILSMDPPNRAEYQILLEQIRKG